MCGVHEGRAVREGDGRGPYRSASRRPKALLGQKQLAGLVPPSSQYEDKTGGSDT